MGKLDNKIAFVTGSSMGIGEGIARTMAEEGATVVLAARSAAKTQAIADELNDKGLRAMAVSVDDPTAPARLLAEFAKSHDKYFNIKAGFLEGKVVDVATVESLAAIPPKDILLSTVLGTMMAPVAALARVLQAVADKKSEGGEAAPAAEAETQA